MSTYTVTPADFGLAGGDNEALKVDDAAASAAKLRSVLDGEPGPARDVVVANAAGALVAANKADTLRDGAALAAAAIDGGAARAKLEAFVALSGSLE